MPAEMDRGWMYRIGAPLPESAVTTDEHGQKVRHIRMGRGVRFDQVAHVWEPNRRILWAYRFQEDSFPPGALDDHVRIGGQYFDIVDTQYDLTPTNQGTELRVRMHYRVDTDFNWYARPIAWFLVKDFEETALAFYARRASHRSSLYAPGEIVLRAHRDSAGRAVALRNSRADPSCHLKPLWPQTHVLQAYSNS
jgi:hypothetical protein